ncbi:MAG: cupin domain-containing protein [Pararheinheimera sp.]|nr:cupin domain-containing protein [Rheinheimera sp.]
MINQLLRQFRLTSTVFHRSLVCDRWQTNTSGSGHMTFHLVFQGSCYLHLPNGSSHALKQGDFVLLPTDCSHVLTDIADADELVATNEQFVAYPLSTLLTNSTGLVCGYFELHNDKQHPLLQALPECIICRRDETDSAIKATLDLLLVEAHAGREIAILERCSELFFVMLLRHMATQNPELLPMLNALQHPRLGPVIWALHSEPGRQWTVESMADLACLSRSAFFDKFKEVIGEPPQSYLTRVRLQQARQQLQSGESVASVAAGCGYHAEEAFAKAFKRQFGYGPGQARKQGG